MNSLLLVVDMQNGFMAEKCRHIIPTVEKLITHFYSSNKLVAFTRFINTPDSGYVNIIHWSRLMSEPEISIIEELKKYVKNVFDKNYYSPFTNEFKDFIEDNKISKVYICGVATDSCVLKSAIDSFENGLEPIVIRDACYSHAGEEAHTAGLYILSRNIGRNQTFSSDDVLALEDL